MTAPASYRLSDFGGRPEGQFKPCGESSSSSDDNNDYHKIRNSLMKDP